MIAAQETKFACCTPSAPSRWEECKRFGGKVQLPRMGYSCLVGLPTKVTSSSRKPEPFGKLAGWMARVDLRRVANARRRLEAAMRERDDAIRAAVASGETYRDVARMAGVSHQRVSQIVRQK